MVRSDLDYKEYQEGKYPEPKDRRNPEDFPSVDELLVYGVDVPCPESVDDLRCPYNFPEQPEDRDDVRVPTIADLHGYKAPPYGLSLVTKLGGGMCSPKFIYAPGTFFENMFGIEKALGPTNAEMIVKREEQRKNAMIAGMADFLEEKGLIEAISTIKDKDAEVIEALFRLALEFIYDSRNPKEARLLANDIADRLADKDAAIKRNEGKPQWTQAQVDKVLEMTGELLRREREDNTVDLGGDEWQEL